MIVSPEGYLDCQRGKSFEMLIDERDHLLKEIIYCECDLRKQMDSDSYTDPAVEIEYQLKLRYMSKLCDYMAEMSAQLVSETLPGTAEAHDLYE